MLNEDNHDFPLNVLNNLVYNPINLTDDGLSVDDHFNHMIREPDCEYYFGDELKLNLATSPSDLCILSHNISSVPLHLDAVVDQFLNSYNSKFHVVSLCETWLNVNISQLYNIMDIFLISIIEILRVVE